MTSFIILYSKYSNASKILINSIKIQSPMLTFINVDNNTIKNTVRQKIKNIPSLLVVSNGNMYVYDEDKMYQTLQENIPNIFGDIQPVSLPQPDPEPVEKVVTTNGSNNIVKGEGHENMKSSLVARDPLEKKQEFTIDKAGILEVPTIEELSGAVEEIPQVIEKPQKNPRKNAKELAEQMMAERKE